MNSMIKMVWLFLQEDNIEMLHFFDEEENNTTK